MPGDWALAVDPPSVPPRRRRGRRASGPSGLRDGQADHPGAERAGRRTGPRRRRVLGRGRPRGRVDRQPALRPRPAGAGQGEGRARLLAEGTTPPGALGGLRKRSRSGAAMSCPGPPRHTSAPGPPMRRSSPASPTSRSRPRLPASWSSPGPADQVVVAPPSARAIDVERPLEHVVAAEAEEDVALEPAREIVVSGGPDDRDRPVEAEDELVRAAVAVGSRGAALVGRAGRPRRVRSAGLASRSACVGVGPPFCRSAPSSGSTPAMSPGPVKPHPRTSATLCPSEDSRRPHSGPRSVARFRANTEFVTELTEVSDGEDPAAHVRRGSRPPSRRSSSMSPSARIPPPRAATLFERVELLSDTDPAGPTKMAPPPAVRPVVGDRRSRGATSSPRSEESPASVAREACEDPRAVDRGRGGLAHGDRTAVSGGPLDRGDARERERAPRGPGSDRPSRPDRRRAA